MNGTFLSLLTLLLETRDSYTLNHSRGVAGLCLSLGKRLGITELDLFQLWTAALFHDVGKIAIPDSILLKRGRLTDREFDIVKRHPVIGSHFLDQINLGFAAESVRCHHEKWNGRGYPDGKKGSEIPLFSRIIHVCDVFDALTTERPYRSALTPHEALREMEETADEFDPWILEHFLRMIREMNNKTR
jgi:HD-GYP domain-containing protein (c-di-GMP phosphodiesterase class II)